MGNLMSINIATDHRLSRGDTRYGVTCIYDSYVAIPRVYNWNTDTRHCLQHLPARRWSDQLSRRFILLNRIALIHRQL